MKNSILRLALGAITVAGISLIGTNPAGAVTFGTNLIFNGDAESGIGSPGSYYTVPGWTTVNSFTALSYSNGGGYPTQTDPGPVNRGDVFFTGGLDGGSSGSQIISLLPSFSEIDAGGYFDQDDNASLSAVFRNGGGTGLGTFSIGPVLAADRSNTTGLFARSTTGAVPIGTRDILVTLTMTRLAGAVNDGYADNLSLVLTNNTPTTPTTSVPEPFTIIGTLVGGTAALRMRKKLRANSNV
jgi:hypothetical protein